MWWMITIVSSWMEGQSDSEVSPRQVFENWRMLSSWVEDLSIHVSIERIRILLEYRLHIRLDE